MGMRVFLTGSSGYLGSVMAEFLARDPAIDGITGIDLVPPSTPLPTKIKFIQMDIRSPDLAAAMAGHEIVVHMAFVVLWPAKLPVAERDDINFNGVRNVARAAAASQVRRFVHASSVAAYDTHLMPGQTAITEEFPIGKGDSPFYYSNGKARAEQSLTEILGTTGIPLTFFRPTYVIGPRNQVTVKAFRANAVNIPGHDPRVQYVHEEDVAAAFLQAVHSDIPGAYNVVPDDFIRLSDVWKILGAHSIRKVPLWAARLVTGVRWRYFGSPTHVSWLEAQLVDVTRSNAKLRATGWIPQYGTADALRSAL
jgi:nucleoside-diphosphate-sugar epimerase